MVNLVQDGQPVRMSKRAGTVVTLDDLVEMVGVDAARYSLIRSSVDVNIDIDLDLLRKQSNENPVYYVQYAHARLAALARNAADLGLEADPSVIALLTEPTEEITIRTLGDFPAVVATAADLRANRTGSAGTWRRWPVRTTASTRSAACFPSGMKRPRM